MPTPADLAREYPLMALVKLRIDLERILRQLAQQQGVTDGPGLRPTLQGLAAADDLPAGAKDFGETLRVLNAAAHGVDVSADAAAAAMDAGMRILKALRRRLEEP